VRFADGAKQAALAEKMQTFAPRPDWQTPQARALFGGEAVLLPVVSDGARARLAHDDAHAHTLRAAGLRSLIVVPLTANGRTHGALTLVNAESKPSIRPG
jgi:hypothetical protein